MKVYNTLSKQKEEFVPLQEGKVSMYVCGPTVYNLIHIGNARPMIVFDTVRRYLEHKGYEVNYVSNFTDVDDKIIAKANEEGVTAKEISERYIAECKKDMAGMNVKPTTLVFPRISMSGIRFGSDPHCLLSSTNMEGSKLFRLWITFWLPIIFKSSFE